MIDDVHSCLSYLRSSEWMEVVDGDRIVLIGHSMGGWAAMMAAAEDPKVLNVAFLAGFNLGGMREFIMESELNRRMALAGFQGLVAPLGGADPGELIDEIVELGEGWNLLEVAERTKGTRVLMVGASRDPTALPELHHMPISNTLMEIDPSNLTVEMLDTDHNFSDRRIALSRAVLDWIMNG
jgi:pimeloyl-ACP methyl ester carboxylesterase